MTGIQAFRLEWANQEVMFRALARKNLCNLVGLVEDPIEALVNAFIGEAEETET